MNKIYHIPFKTIDNKETTLEPFAGKVMLIVNVASRCGFTPQYADLEALQKAYGDRGFTVIAFPSNQFLNQEPGDNHTIQTFAESCYHITFPLFGKLKVNGPDRAPLYTHLAKHIQKKPLKLIPWNFTKILVDTQGNVIQRFLPTTSFNTLKKAIEPLLPLTATV